MKARKSFVAALSMLLLSAVLLSTASYAWFSMNTNVKVTGIEFVAYSDSLFLEISKDNSTFTSGDIKAELQKKYLRPVAFGTIEQIGGAYSVNPAAASGRFVVADDPANQKYYYKAVKKANTNDTYFGDDVFDYYCVNEELHGAASVEGLYIEGSGITFSVVKSATSSAPLYKKTGNNYIAYTLKTDESAYGYYTVNAISQCGAKATYSPANVYYEYRDGNYYLAGGLDEGSDLEGYYTLDPKVAAPSADSIYWLKSSGSDAYTDYIAFKTAAAVSNANNLPEQGYWYRGYSESLDNTFDGDTEDDGEKDRVNGVINGAYTDENTPYYLHTTYYLRMASASGLADNLRINNVEVLGSESDNSLTNAVRVMLVVSSNVQDKVIRITYNNRTGEFTREAKDGVVDDTTLFYNRFLGNKEEVVTVQVYLFYDGTDANVNSNATLDFSGHTVNLEFGIDVPDYMKYN